MWLRLALFFLCLRGCLSLTGPGYVTGTVGGSLRVQCQYEEGYEGYNKYWCRGQHDTECHSLVETKGTEKEERCGHVSIRDSAGDLTVTVTMDDLKEGDAGTYWCKIQRIFIWDAWAPDLSVQVNVSVSPATTFRATTLPATTPTTLLVTTRLSFSTKMLTLSLWSLLSSVHFQLLVFLKLPLFLSMLCAVLWVNRPQRTPGRRQSCLSSSPAVQPPRKALSRGAAVQIG